MIRGNYSKACAPSISNLFAGDGDSFETYADPCAAANGPTGAVLAQCIAQGVPAGFVQPNTRDDDGVPQSGAAQTAEPFTWKSNPNLKPET